VVYAATALLSGVITVDERAAITARLRRATGRVPGLAVLLVPVTVKGK